MRSLTPALSLTLTGLTLLLLAGCSDSNSGSDAGPLPLPDPTTTQYVDGRYIARGAQEQYIEDTRTGLVWKRCADGQTWDQDAGLCLGRATSMSFGAANGDELIDDPNNPDQQRISGFVIPSLEQLQTLIYCPDQPLTPENIGTGECTGFYSQATLATEVFPDAERITHWTSTCMSETCTSYKGVDFSTGLISTYNSPNATYPLRRVRPL